MASAPLIITLDGPAGVGKSTLAQQVASHLGIGYLDTGAMFRILAFQSLGLSNEQMPLDDDGAKLLDAIGPLNFMLVRQNGASSLQCNNKLFGNEIRNESVASRAAQIAALPAVRTFLKTAQRQIGATTPLVAEGRDMGTVVFPQASHKFFLDASAEVRAKRRYDQITISGQSASITEIAEQIRARDHQDRNRPVAPLVPAPDAIVIDTSHSSISEVLTAILAHCPSPSDAETVHTY